MDDAGLKKDHLSVAGKGSSHASSLEGATELLDRENPPTALITLSGQGILAVLELAAKLNLNIPGQLSVIAFDEQPWSPFMNPLLTTISQPVAEMAGEAVTFLKNNWKGNSSGTEPNLKRVLTATLCERDSVREYS